MWANTICSKAEDIGKKSKDGSIINACFNPDFACCLKKLIPYLPLWIGIMRHYFEKSSVIATKKIKKNKNHKKIRNKIKPNLTTSSPLVSGNAKSKK